MKILKIYMISNTYKGQIKEMQGGQMTVLVGNCLVYREHLELDDINKN